MTFADEEQEHINKVLSEYDGLWRGGIRGKSTLLEHRIRLEDDRPIKCRARTYTQDEQAAINTEIEKMIADQVIQPSQSQYSSEIVMVRKKTKEWRVCIDYRPINKKTIKDNFPLPRISELIKSIKNSKYFVALDLRAGYWQIPMAEDSKKYTAFRCSKGLFEFNVMPFGLTNAPATFQRTMEFLLGDLRRPGVL
eukprot:GHVO01032576.1.p1 GENE.GHVO01032576.1~~GHVO01032576.1.p1  ORF type:complete len:195 (-),score=13.42 GHVO01032576.1:652-1236(-)